MEHKLMVNMYKKRKGKEEQIHVVVCVKKRILNTNSDEEMEDEDPIMTDNIPERFIDKNELMNILRIYNNNGLLGILESFGMTFANVKFSTDQLDLGDESSIPYQIYQCNSTMETDLRKYLCDFLTSFSIQFSKDFKYHNPEADYLQFLECQFEEAKIMAEKLNRLTPESQFKLLRTFTPSLFLPLFKLKNMIDNLAQISKSTFQEYFVMVFKRLHIFSHAKEQGVIFKTREPLKSNNLKLSLNVMNNQWTESANRIQADFTLLRHYKDYIHYFIIGEFAHCDIKASTAEEFLCSHKETIKILLEGRSVLMDILNKTSTDNVHANIRKELVMTMFLADTSGKMVFLKLRPIFHKISSIESLYGVYFEFSYSRLLNVFYMKDACMVMSEIDNCVEVACKFSYQVDENSTTTNLVATPMTLKSKSEIAKLNSIPLEKGDVSLRFFLPENETQLYDKLAKEFPNLSIRKTERVVSLSEIGTIPIRFSIPFSGEIAMNGIKTMTVCGNPIEACYPFLDKYEVRFKIILLESDTKIDIDYTKMPQDDEEDFTESETPQSTGSEEDFKKQIQDIKFKQWGLMEIFNKEIHTRTISSASFGELESYICYCEGKLCINNTDTVSVFVKIHSGHEMETYNEHSLQSTCLKGFVLIVLIRNILLRYTSILLKM